jgi:hypothetical protein
MELSDTHCLEWPTTAVTQAWLNMVITQSKWPTDYNQKAWKWALSIQGKFKQHYWCHRIFNIVCLLGFGKPDWLSQYCVKTGAFRFALSLWGWLQKLSITDHHWR